MSPNPFWCIHSFSIHLHCHVLLSTENQTLHLQGPPRQEKPGIYLRKRTLLLSLRNSLIISSSTSAAPEQTRCVGFSIDFADNGNRNRGLPDLVWIAKALFQQDWMLSSPPAPSPPPPSLSLSLSLWHTSRTHSDASSFDNDNYASSMNMS